MVKTAEKTDVEILQGFIIKEHTNKDTQVYTDGAKGYCGIDRPHEAVKHSAGEYVRHMAHTNGMESFWSTLKLGYHGVYHHMSEKHLNRNVEEFAGRHNVRSKDTVNQMKDIVSGMVGKQLKCDDLIADNGLALRARS